MSRRVTRGEFHRSCRVCGWKGTYTSARMADYGKRRHSCARWLAKAAAAERGRERMAGVDRTPKSCLHKEADHQHGTYACYVLDACRCPPCANAHRVYETNRIRQQAYGRWDNYVDAAPAREHIRSLMAQGMGLKRIVAVSDISQGLLWKLVYGKKKPDGSQIPSKRVRKDTEARILAITLDLASGACVDSTGTTRRIQALVALGWSQSKIAARIGVHPGNLTPIAHGARQVSVATEAAVRALYDELSMTLPPEETHRDKIAASRSRSYAKAHGWLPPLAWDDEQLDDPAHRPSLEHKALTHDDQLDEAAIYRRMHGDKSVRLSKADTAELVRRWVAAGRSLRDCELTTGIKPDRFYRLKDQEQAS